MTIRFYILICLTFEAAFSFACLNTYQFKVFPVGVSNGKIYTVDFQIRRASQFERSELPDSLIFPDKENEIWILNAYISEYDKKQKLISSIPIDSAFEIGKHYLDTLLKVYNHGFERIIKYNPSIELFTPVYISFCDFQQKCNFVSIIYDSVADKDYFIYENKKYAIDIMDDTSFYGFGERTYLPENISGLYISSVRIYRTKTLKLVISHLATGHEISMGWITIDPEKVKISEGEFSMLAKEHKPGFTFTEIKKSVYEEPLLHHGYGFDIFIVK